MAGCGKERFEDMLHAYELGMLPPNERRELEHHLLECSYCLESVKSFEETASHLKYERSIRERIDVLAGECDKRVVTDRRKPVWWSESKTWRRFAPALVLASVCLLLILRPWNIGIQTTEEVLAHNNVLAVMYLQNLAEPDDPERLGDIATNLLITDLSESAYLQVVSSQRLYDILKLLGREGDRGVQPDVASEVAARARAKWMLSGSILQTEPRLIIATQLFDVKTGVVVGSQRIVGEPEEDIFALVDGLTIAIKHDLPLPSQALTEPDPYVSNVTTSSREAYRLLIEGKEYAYMHYLREAADCFERALEHDSTLAQAYYGLADVRQDTSYLAKALQYIDNVSQVEKHYIWATHAFATRDDSRGIELLETIVRRYPDEKEAYLRLGDAWSILGDVDSAASCYREAIRIDPLFKNAYNSLAYTYDRLDQTDSAIAALDKYIALAPNEPNPYDSRGEIYARHGRIDEAIQSFKQALEIKPDFYPSFTNLGLMYLFKGDYEGADSYFRESLAMDARPNSRLRLALVSMRSGRFGQALQILQDGIVADRLENEEPEQFDGHLMKFVLRAAIYAERGEFSRALAEEELFLKLCVKDSVRRAACSPSAQIWLLAEGGKSSEAKDELERLKSRLEEADAPMNEYELALGFLARVEGDFTLALEHFERAASARSNFYEYFILAEAYLNAGRMADAIQRFEDLRSQYTYDRAMLGHWSVKIHYYLGVAYEETGRIDDAVGQYETYLDILKDADPGLPAASDAVHRLTRLRNR